MGGTATHISGWKDPSETDARLTRNILSMCIKPCPILQQLSTLPSGGTPYDMRLSDVRASIMIMRTYSHSGEVPVEFSCNFERELATRYRLTLLGPVQCMDLLHYN